MSPYYPLVDSSYYSFRGLAYEKLSDYQQAINDSTKVIELDPKNAKGYVYRGFAYFKLENYQQAINDFKIAARLGDKNAQEFLKKQGIKW